MSSKEREDEERRRRNEFDEPGFFCRDPFGDWIQTILDERRP